MITETTTIGFNKPSLNLGLALELVLASRASKPDAKARLEEEFAGNIELIHQLLDSGEREMMARVLDSLDDAMLSRLADDFEDDRIMAVYRFGQINDILAERLDCHLQHKLDLDFYELVMVLGGFGQFERMSAKILALIPEATIGLLADRETNRTLPYTEPSPSTWRPADYVAPKPKLRAPMPRGNGVHEAITFALSYRAGAHVRPLEPKIADAVREVSGIFTSPELQLLRYVYDSLDNDDLRRIGEVSSDHRIMHVLRAKEFGWTLTTRFDTHWWYRKDAGFNALIESLGGFDEFAYLTGKIQRSVTSVRALGFCALFELARSGPFVARPETAWWPTPADRPYRSS